MKTYVINLEKDTHRREYMSELLQPYEGLDCSFVKAIYGKYLSPTEVDAIFDVAKAYKRYGRPLNSGEIGCAASHNQVYKHIINSSDEWALVFEDDVTILNELPNLDEIVKKLPTTTPAVLFLSGDYWYTALKPLAENLKLAHVFDAVGAYAYIINREAAKLITGKNPKPSYVADHWSLLKEQGVRLYALYPYLVDANIEGFTSTIGQSYFGEVRRNMSVLFRFKSYKLSLMKKWLLKKGQFVSKIRR